MKIASFGAATFAAALACFFANSATAQDAVAYQINAAHSGATKMKGFKGKLSEAWRKRFKGAISYPLIAEGMVFVTVRNVSDYGTKLYALDANSGDTVWSRAIEGVYYWSAAAYDNGTIFVLNYDSVVRAFAAQTGVQLWKKQIGSGGTKSAPIAVNHTLYFASGRAAFAVDELDGHTKWTQTSSDYFGSSSPAFGRGGIYLTSDCYNYKFANDNGNVLWQSSDDCGSGVSNTPVYGFGQIFARNPNVILASDTGQQLGEFDADPAPALFTANHAQYGVSLSEDGTLAAFDLNSHATLWSFEGDGQLRTAPIVVNGYVIEGSGSGELYAIDGLDGAVRWSENVGESIPPPDESGNVTIFTGLGAGDGVVVVPTQPSLIAFKPQ